jgi:hypothetical protein
VFPRTGKSHELQLRREADAAEPQKLAKRKHQINSLFHAAKLKASSAAVSMSEQLVCCSMWLSPLLPRHPEPSGGPGLRLTRAQQQVMLQYAGAGDAERPGQLNQNEAGNASKVWLVMRCNAGPPGTGRVIAHAAIRDLTPDMLSRATVAYSSSRIADCCVGSMRCL